MISSYKFQFFLFSIICLSFLSSPKLHAKKKKIKIKIGTVVPEGTPWADLAVAVRKEIQKRAKKEVPGFKIKVKSYLGGTLGGEISMAKKLLKGKLDIFGGTMGPYTKMIPELSVIELPYLFNNAKEAYEILDTVLYKKITGLFNKKGLIFMVWAENGFRNFASKTPIKSPNDLKGKKFRSQEQETYINTYKALGGTPVPIAVPEVMGALQTDVVSGFDQTLLYSFATSWYTNIKHFTISEHIYQPGVLFCGKKKYDSYPDGLKKIIDSDWRHMLSFRKKVRDLNPNLITNLQKAGVNVIKLSKKEKESFKVLVKPVYKKYRKSASKEAKLMLKAIEKHLKRKL